MRGRLCGGLGAALRFVLRFDGAWAELGGQSMRKWQRMFVRKRPEGVLGGGTASEKRDWGASGDDLRRTWGAAASGGMFAGGRRRAKCENFGDQNFFGARRGHVRVALTSVTLSHCSCWFLSSWFSFFLVSPFVATQLGSQAYSNQLIHTSQLAIRFPITVVDLSGVC
jgi:hypothetical protein